MVYKIKFISDEVDGFLREIKIDSDSSFLDLCKVILKSCNYPDDQMTSFFMCNDRWEKGQEVTLVEMGSNFEYDNMVMESTRISELLEECGQRMIYVYDPMFERYFFGRLSEILPGVCTGVTCVQSTGVAPQQLQQVDAITTKTSVGNEWDIDDDFYGDSQYNEGDLDMDSYQDLSFDDGSMF